MSKVFVDVGIPLDSFIAGPNDGLVGEITIHIAPLIISSVIKQVKKN